jgi:hypothetical protein
LGTFLVSDQAPRQQLLLCSSFTQAHELSISAINPQRSGRVFAAKIERLASPQSSRAWRRDRYRSHAMKGGINWQQEFVELRSRPVDAPKKVKRNGPFKRKGPGHRAP